MHIFTLLLIKGFDYTLSIEQHKRSMAFNVALGDLRRSGASAASVRRRASHSERFHAHQ